MSADSPRRTSSASGARKGRWSTAEVAWLRENYPRMRDEALARRLGRPEESLKKMAQQAFRGPRRTGAWDAEEDAVLRSGVGIREPEELAMVLRRPVAEVNSRIGTLARQRRSGRWTLEELAELKRVYGSRLDKDLAVVLGRSEASIRRQAKQLRLAKDKSFLRRLEGKPASRMPRWTPEEVRKLTKLYSELPNLEVARRLGRSVKSIVSKAHELELKKSAERLQDMGRSNVALRSDRRGR